MSAYTALVSLRQILELQLQHNLYNRPQLQNLLEEVDMLLSFLDSSSAHEGSQISELEAKMRDVAHEAENLIDHGILNNHTICSGKILLLHILFMMFSPLPARLGLIPLWAPFILVEAVICISNAAFIHLRIRERYGFPTKYVSQEWRRLFYEFKVIVEEVNQIKESSSGISAQEELVSLRRILGSITREDDSGHLRTLQGRVTFLLENNAASSSTQNLNSKMRNAIYKAKRALVEFQLPRKSDVLVDASRFGTQPVAMSLSPTYMFLLIRYAYFLGIGPQENQMPWQTFIACASYFFSFLIAVALLPNQYNYEAPGNQALSHVVNDFDIIVQELIEIKDGRGEEAAELVTAASSRKDFKGTGNGRDAVVGLESDMQEIKTLLIQDLPERQLISIVGMGGIGKTTLARQVYHDPAIKGRFDVRAWTAVSQENSLRHVLLSLLDSVQMLTEEKHQASDVELGLCLHQFLMNRRYLIVVDDVWDTEIWNFLSRHFPDNCNKSRVLLTSRLPNVVGDLGCQLHRMQCLDENHSWELLRREAFGVVEGCPPELESIGRRIAQRCGGLPLAIAVIGGLLSKETRSEVWIDIAKNLEKSQVEDIKEQCLDILSLSYSHLPRHLKPCFLYTGLFLAHTEIFISTLIHLWIAEGFLKSRESKTIEEEAEGYIKDLIDRNMISVSKWSCNGKMRRCRMHDLLRDVCVENARKEKFRHVEELGGYVITREGLDESSPRSVSMDPNVERVDDLDDYLGSVELRVVNVVGAKFPRKITRLVRLRYLAFQYDGSAPIALLPPFTHKLQYLETLVLHHSSSAKYPYLPSSIWRMPNLRHIYVKPSCYMFKLLGHRIFLQCSFLMNLQTLVGIRNFKWTTVITEKVPNLRKLGISYDFSSSANWSTYHLENLVYLEKLESLKITIKYNDLGSATPNDPPKLAFPQKLRKVSLSGCRIPWESMTAIGALPNLEALKLRCDAFCGPSWETVEGEFPQLMYLLLEEMSFSTWKTEESCHFPRLQRLVLRSCDMLEEIPFCIGDIPALELIHLVDCPDSAVDSVKDIKEEQESMGNEDLKVYIEPRREVHGMKSGNSEARGVGPGFFEVLYDAVSSTHLEVLVILVFRAALLIALISALGSVF